MILAFTRFPLTPNVEVTGARASLLVRRRLAYRASGSPEC